MQILSILLAFFQEPEVIQQAFPAFIIPLIALALSGATTGMAMGKQAKAGREAKAARNEILGHQRSLADEYNAERSKNYLETSSGLSSLSALNDQFKKFINSSNNNIISGGGTNEAAIASKGAANEQYNRALTQLSGLGTNYKMGLGDRYAQMLQQIGQGQDRSNMASLQSWGNVSQGASSAFMNTAGTTDWEAAFAKK